MTGGWGKTNQDKEMERIQKDAAATVEKIIQATRVTLQDEMAIQQMEYEQLYGLNSAQWDEYLKAIAQKLQGQGIAANLATNWTYTRIPKLSPDGTSSGANVDVVEKAMLETITNIHQSSDGKKLEKVPPIAPMPEGATPREIREFLSKSHQNLPNIQRTSQSSSQGNLPRIQNQAQQTNSQNMPALNPAALKQQQTQSQNMPVLDQAAQQQAQAAQEQKKRPEKPKSDQPQDYSYDPATAWDDF